MLESKRSAQVRELLSNNSLFVGQLYVDKSLALRARDLIFFTTDPQTVNYYKQFTAGADLFLKWFTDFIALFHSQTRRHMINIPV